MNDNDEDKAFKKAVQECLNDVKVRRTFKKLRGSVRYDDPQDLIDGITPDNQHPSWYSFFEDALPADADF